MKLYEDDSLIYHERDGGRYVVKYKGFCAGSDYQQWQTFSSRHIPRGCTWPTRAVRDMWDRLRSVHITTIPGAMQR